MGNLGRELTTKNEELGFGSQLLRPMRFSTLANVVYSSLTMIMSCISEICAYISTHLFDSRNI